MNRSLAHVCLRGQPSSQVRLGALGPADERAVISCSAIIVHRNAPFSTVEACVRAIRGAALETCTEVIIVDQGVDPGFHKRMAMLDPGITVLTDTSDGGYSVSNNLGLLQSRGRYLLLVNDDVVLSPGAIDAMVRWMEARPTCGYLGPRVVLPSGALDVACRRSFPTPIISLYRLSGLSTLCPHSALFGRYNLTYVPEDVTMPVEAVVGACMLVRREAALEVGLLDESYFMYGEDLDWCFRLHRAGWQGWYLASILAIHLKRSSSMRRRLKTSYEFYRAMIIFFRRHFLATTPLPVAYCIIVAVLLRGSVAVLSALWVARSSRR
ncbi:MAG: glycosyltransferase family 2 protein [Chloroflexi bacterium]|nr:glycosyltransferase family 2 protein [Chloroflexota bacterium]